MSSKHGIIKLRRGTAAEWAASEPQPGGEVLKLGEPGFEKDTGKLKIGDGITGWNNLPYLQAENSEDVILTEENVDDAVGNLLVGGSGINVNYNDDLDTLTISVSGLTSSFIGDFDESVQDNLNTSLVAGTGIVLSYDDIANTLTINSSGGVSINNAENNRVLTSDGTSDGIDAENNLTFNGSLLAVSGDIVANTGTLDRLIFNTTLGDPDLDTAQLAWNPSEGTVDLGVSDTYAMHLGEELHYRVRNNTASTLVKGTPVYASGLTPGGNNRIEIAPFTADGNVREVRFMGLVTENISNGVNGYTTHFGYIRGIDTRGDAASNGYAGKLWDAGEPSWSEGDILYAHPTVAGKLTKVEPKHSISVAIILNRHQNQGKIFVRPTSYGHLDDNHDVAVSGATNGQFLQYNSATDYWVPSSSGNFTTLLVNGTGVSVSGHSHVTNDITNFNTSVSGLLPTIANSGDNRVLTSTGTSTGVNAESNLTFDGTTLGVTGVIDIDNLRLDSNTISSTNSNGNIVLAPNGTGDVQVDADTLRVGDSNATATITSNGTGNLTLNTNGGTNSGSIVIQQGSNNDIILEPNGTGQLQGSSTGNSRGSYATDWQRVRALNTQVASGSYSVIGGGRNNTSSAGYSTVGGGYTNSVSGSSSSYTTIGGGISNSVSGNGSYSSTIGGGNSNSVSGSSSSYTTIGGGENNSVSGNYSSNITIGGGSSNSVSGNYSNNSTIGGGNSNSVSGNYSSYTTIGGGNSNSVSGSSSSNSTIGGGRSNSIGNNAPHSTISGGYRAKTTRYGETSHAAGNFANNGDSQHTILIARRTTTNATANQVLFLDGSSLRLTLPAETTWTFSVKLSAYNDTDNQGGWWIFRGGIRRNAANGTALIGSLITESGTESSLSTASASVVADDTNEALEIRVTGVASKNIRWVAVVDISQVSYAAP